MKVKKTIQIEVEYNIDDSISDIDFTRVENFDNFNFDDSVDILSVKESKVETEGTITISINEKEESALKAYDCGLTIELKKSLLNIKTWVISLPHFSEKTSVYFLFRSSICFLVSIPQVDMPLKCNI